MWGGCEMLILLILLAVHTMLFSQNKKTKIISVSSLKSERCDHTPLKNSSTKKEDLARGLKFLGWGGLVNHKYWHAAGNEI